jgi:hypothetical protein
MKYLARGLMNRLFKRRVADGLVVCAGDRDDVVLPTEEGDDRIKRPTATSPPQQFQAGIDPEATVILGNLWSDGDLRMTTIRLNRIDVKTDFILDDDHGSSVRSNFGLQADRR